MDDPKREPTKASKVCDDENSTQLKQDHSEVDHIFLCDAISGVVG